MNAFKTGVLMLLIFVILLFLGEYVGGTSGLVMALGIALLLNGIAYWFSDKIILAIYGAREVTAEQAPRLYSIVESLASRANLPMPKVYIIHSESPNAFATGRNPKHAAVAATTGILRLLNDQELAGVIGHELAHVGNRDILIQTVVATVAGAITFLSRMALFFGGGRDDDERRGNPLGLILLSILAPIAAFFIQMWISRTREYAADERGAQICGNPLYLANALRKLEMGVSRVPAEVNPATAHMFIVAPISGRSILTIFSTHPPIEERVRRLVAMAERHGIR